MAGRVNMKAFYGILALIAVVGAAAVWMASQGSGDAITQIMDAPDTINAEAFPGYVMGSEDAPVEIVEYADFTCDHCATFAVLQGPDVKSRLVQTGMARWRFRGFALSQASLVPLHAADCAGEQSKFWEMHDQLMFRQSDWLRSDPGGWMRTFRGYAGEIGVDLDRYAQCMEEGRYASRIMATREELVAMGISSTPTFDIGGQRANGAIPYDQLRALVDQAIERNR